MHSGTCTYTELQNCAQTLWPNKRLCITDRCLMHTWSFVEHICTQTHTHTYTHSITFIISHFMSSNAFSAYLMVALRSCLSLSMPLLPVSLSLSGWSRQRSVTWWYKILMGNSWKPLRAWQVSVHYYTVALEFIQSIVSSFSLLLWMLIIIIVC